MMSKAIILSLMSAGLVSATGFHLDQESRLMYNDAYVCDDYFNDNAARMVCSELGKSFVRWGDASLPGNSRDFSMDDLRCPAGADSLDDCTHNTNHNCYNSEGVLLLCGGCFEHDIDYHGNDLQYLRLETHNPQACQDRCAGRSGCTHFTYNPRDGSCWLKDSMSGWEIETGLISGRRTCDETGFSVDSANRLMWNNGYVCDDWFNDAAGRVACAEMGMDFESWGDIRLPGNSRRYTMDDLRCPSGATSLDQCTHTPTHNCYNSEAVLLNCRDRAFTITSAGVLKFGSGYVCDDHFGYEEANMVCATLGQGLVSFGDANLPGNSRDFTMDDLQCPAGADSLDDCTYTSNHNCWSSEAVSLTCGTPVEGFHFDDAGAIMYGYGYVCDDSFGQEEAEMICASMGLALGSYGDATVSGTFSIDDLNCPSGATSLSQCTYTANHNCGSSEGVRLTCTNPTPQIAFPQDNESEFWHACGSVGTIARGKIIRDYRRITADQCAIRCNANARCEFWNYDARARRCYLRRTNSQTVPIVHGTVGSSHHRNLSGNKICAYGGYPNIWDALSFTMF